MAKLIKLTLAGTVPILIALLLSGSAGAAGLGMGPSKIEITEALKGEQHEHTIFLKYTDDADCVVELSATGDIADWVSFYCLDDPATPIDSAVAPAKEWAYFRVKFDIPSDAPLGTSGGSLYAVTVPPDVGEGGTVSLQGRVDVTIDVVGPGGMPVGLIIGIIAAVLLPATGLGIVLYRRRTASGGEGPPV